jgi:predicted Rossmann fold nucleotide-binding protein DprA/Smf involved in DNA uptake
VVIAAVEDALALLGISAPKTRPLPVLADAERRIWDALETGYTELDALALRAELSVPETLAGITSLEMLGLIECAASGEVRRA